MKTKEYYSLWWKYLKRSEAYKEFCLIADQKNIHKDFIPTATQKKITNHYTGSVKIDFENKYKVNMSNFIIIFKTWGDVHKNIFDEWWKQKGESEFREPNIDIIDIRKDTKLQTKISEFCINCCHKYRAKKDYSQHDFLEIITAFRNFLSNSDNQKYLFFKVNILSDMNSDDIAREITKLRTEQKSKTGGKFPYERLRSELDNYLMVYDLKVFEKKKMADIIKEIGTKSEIDKCNDADTLRQYRRYFRKAKAIIRNVEKNQFPGKY
ncbi:MAG: hypothetical protein ABFD82_07825 [Syntrophaceae bacterium]